MKKIFHKINDYNDSISIIKIGYIVNYFLGFMNFLFIPQVGIERLYDGIIHLIFTVLVHKKNSRIAAIFLLIFPIQKLFYITLPESFVFSIAILLIDIRLIEATFKIRNQKKHTEIESEKLVKNT